MSIEFVLQLSPKRVRDCFGKSIAKWNYGQQIPDLTYNNYVRVVFDTMEQYSEMKKELLNNGILVKG